MKHLLSYKNQIESNLRRTASKGLISLLNHQQLEDLAFKYFGVKDEFGNIIGYQCPYSGKVSTNYKDIVLEHIIPVISNGGTVLFNCIPTSKEVNGTDQKGAKHLIEWWRSSNYWDKDAPLRLEKIVNYMLDGYEQVFTEYTVDEVESSYLDIESDDSILEEEDNPNINARTESKLSKQAKNNGIYSYLVFINDCIKTLEKYNINTFNIKERLQRLQEQNIFKDIDKYQIYQNIIQKLIISRIGDNNSSYLTYTLNFDIKKLMDSINLDNEQDISNELHLRLTNIENLLQENNLSIIEYFKSLKDIQEIDFIYKNINNISQQEITAFLENIKIGIDTKIEIFIKMLNQGNSKILKRGNKETLEGYPSINLSYFWNRYQEKIQQKLFIELKDSPGYNIARQTVLTYFKVSTYEELIAKQEELSAKNEIDLDTKISIYIKMLNQGNFEILKRGNKETLEGYPSINLANFWNSHQAKIQQKLFIELKDNPEYNIARQTVLTYFKVSTYEELIAKQEELSAKNEIDIDTKISIYIKMLNKGNEKILNHRNKETLEGYPSINLSYFWNRYQDKIKQKLFIELKDNPGYNIARQTVLTYFKVSTYEELIAKQEELSAKNEIDLDTKISIYIKMLNQGNFEILKEGNKETIEGYPSINLSYFWKRYQEKIKQKLFIELKDNPGYNIARQTVLTDFKVSAYEELIAKQEEWSSKNEIDLDTKLSIYIKMLNQGNFEILKEKNTETLEGYPSINVSCFWNRYQDKIKQKLFIELKDNPGYDIARQTVLTYFKVSTYEELIAKQEELSAKNEIDLDTKISIYIKMLNKGNEKILNQRNKETLEGYPSINVSHYWSQYQDKIKRKLFEEQKNNPKYDVARQTVLTYFKVSTYEELIAKQEELSAKNEIDLDTKISIYIKMLNQGNSKILTRGNKETLEGYPSINLASFWQNNQEKIKQKLFIELKDSPGYNIARQTVLTYFKVSTYEELIAKQEELSAKNEIDLDTKISIYIKMLNQGNSKILTRGNKETLEGYPSINLANFWNRYQDKIKQKLFIELKDNPGYDIARQTVLTYFKVSTYEELETKQNKGKKLKEAKKMKQELVQAIKYVDEIEVSKEEQRKRA